MDFVSARLAAACLTTAAAALVGWFFPYRRGQVSVSEVGVFCVGLALAATTKPSLAAFALSTLPPGVYYAFAAWRKYGSASQHAFFWAFYGAVWFYSVTCASRSLLMLVPWLLVFAGVPAARWLTQRTHHSVGFALVVIATLFQLSRVPLLLG